MNSSTHLMPEMLSPNVTKLIPLDFSDFTEKFVANKFTVTPHNHGIFEFDVSVNAYYEKVICDTANKAFKAHKDLIYNVDITGIKSENSGVGSTRFCTMNHDFAKWLTSVIKGRSAVDVIKDVDGSWMEMINVSQYFRFMKYVNGGEHFPHYDSDFHYEYNDTYTKYSMVIYFTKCESGEIAFVNDKGTEFEGKTCDWTRQARDSEIYLKFLPGPLKIVCFPHTLCHTVLPYVDPHGSRIICRGDILYRKANK